MKPELIPHVFYILGCLCFLAGTVIAMVQQL